MLLFGNSTKMREIIKMEFKIGDKIQIVKASKDYYWYSDRIGDVFNVRSIADLEWIGVCDEFGEYGIVLKEDCKLFVENTPSWNDTPKWANVLLKNRSIDGFAWAEDYKDDSKAIRCAGKYTFLLKADYWKLVEHRPKHNEENRKMISPEDEVTITTTYGELAKVYAVLSGTNGESRGKDLWDLCSELLCDSYAVTRNKKYWSFGLHKKTPAELLNYTEYQDAWEKHLFQPKETEQQRKIRELEETIKKAQEQIQSLKDSAE